MKGCLSVCICLQETKHMFAAISHTISAAGLRSFFFDVITIRAWYAWFVDAISFFLSLDRMAWKKINMKEEQTESTNVLRQRCPLSFSLSLSSSKRNSKRTMLYCDSKDLCIMLLTLYFENATRKRERKREGCIYVCVYVLNINTRGGRENL